MQINVARNLFAKSKIEWLGRKITQSGKTPVANKTDTVDFLCARQIKKVVHGCIRSDMVSVNH